MQAVNNVRVRALVESSFLQRRTDQNSSIAARYKVHLGSADHVTQQVMPCAGHGQHLTLDRPGGEVMGGETAGPRASAIHHARRVVMGSLRYDAGSPPIGEKHVGHRGTGG